VLRGSPQLAKPIDRQLALLAPRGMHRVLEPVHRDLAEHGGDLVFEVRREQRQSLLRLRHLAQQASKRDRLTEHGCRLGERERRALMEHALSAREVRVQAVTQLVREGQHVAPTRRPVQQQVRVMRRHGVRAERARPLARACRRIDPRAVEEQLRSVGELAGERRVRVEHQFARRAPSDLGLRLADRGHAVVVGQTVEPEQLGLERVPTLRDGIATAHCVDQRLHGFVARFV
jgi:hypothetical protein